RRHPPISTLSPYTTLFRSETVEGIKRRGLVLASLTRLKQICNHPSQWLGDGAYAPEDSGKLARLREICEVIASRQEKALVFTQRSEEHTSELQSLAYLVCR